MYQSTYYVDKTTDTFADVLLAYGVASLLERLLKANSSETTMRVQDAGSVYAIHLEDPIEEGFEKIDWFCDLPFIQTGKKKPPKGWPGVVVDYAAERDRRAEYFEARDKLPPEAKRPGATVDEFPELAAVHALAPRPDWDILAQINQMGAISAYSKVLTAWYESRVCFPDLLRLTLALIAVTPNDIENALEAWRSLDEGFHIVSVLREKYNIKLDKGCNVTPVQVLNPAMGKGINRPKADRADQLGNPDSFWPLEFLKFWGMRRSGVPRIVRPPKPTPGRPPKDRKTYVLRPYNITLDTHDKVYRAFNRAMWSNTAVKMDVLAALRYTDVFLDQWLAGQLIDARWGEEPGDYVNGLATAFYKDMGSAVALLNLSEISLPRWMKVEDEAQGRAYRQMLDEHRRVVDSLQEKNADEYRLLQTYRDFLSGHNLEAFFAFTAGYARLTMSRIDKGGWAPRFTTTNLEVLIMGHNNKLKPILENEGFQNIAAAIRRSTVIPQYFKAKGKKGPYDIHYGLGAELLRQAAYPDRFIQALSAFLHEYNRETMQIFERYKGNPPVRRSRVTTDDIQQIIALIDEYGSQTVANLLVAYGYAREPREVEEQPGEVEIEEFDEEE
jgi:hypothetical protein